MAKLTEMSDEDAAATLLRVFRNACDAYDPASGEPHPGQVIKKMRMDTAEWVRASATGASPGASERQIQSQDNPPDFENKPENPTLSVPPRPTQDGKTTIIEKAQDRFMVGSDNVARFEFADGRVLFGNDALVARARQANPSRAKRMADALGPTYNRLK
jgi:hypothetical protein